MKYRFLLEFGWPGAFFVEKRYGSGAPLHELAQEIYMQRRSQRQKCELINPNLRPDHEQNRLDPVFRARISSDLHEEIEKWRLKNGFSKRTAVEMLFEAATRPAVYKRHMEKIEANSNGD